MVTHVYPELSSHEWEILTIINISRAPVNVGNLSWDHHDVLSSSCMPPCPPQ